MAISIISISPTTGAIGVSLHEKLKVVFSTGIEKASLGSGTFFIEGSDKDVLSGPYVPINFQGTSFDPLVDPAYAGLVRGTYTCEYIGTNGSALATNFTDTSGTAAYHTRITFTPERPFSPLHQYRAYIVGTSSDQSDLALHSRTIFDPIIDPLNTGNAKLFPRGAYTHTANGTYIVEILSDGVVGSASYKWKYNAEAFSPATVTHSYGRQLRHGVSVAFDLEGTFKALDKFTFITKPREYFSSITQSYFITGEYGTQLLPDDTNSLISRLAPATPSFGQAGFSLHHTVPPNLFCDVDSTQASFTFYFTKPINPSTLDTNGIRIYIGPSNGDTCIREETSYTPNHVEIVNSTCLVVYLENT